MSQTACGQCKRLVDEAAERCPHCGLIEPAARRSGAHLLVSASQIHRPKVNCRGCGQRVSLGVSACPACGRRRPTSSRIWRLAPLALSVLPAIGVAAAWQLGVLEPLIRGPSLRVVTGEVNTAAAPERPTTRSARFDAVCDSAAPVLVYGPDHAPSAFRVVLTGEVSRPARVADSLAEHYRLSSGGYEASTQGFVVDNPQPDVVARLRCEPAVSTLEESAAVSR